MKTRKRDEILGDYIGTNCPYVEILRETEKTRMVRSVDNQVAAVLKVCGFAEVASAG